MKRSEVYIQKLSKEFGISIPTATVIYKAINKFDWAVFCSYMADYDHPEERTAARHELQAFRNNYSDEMKEVIDNIQYFMSNDNDYCIHDMEKEYEEK